MNNVSVLFVCLGNICRSPTAHGIFEGLVADSGLQDRIYIDSAGTGDWHVGKAPDKRAQAAAAQRGYDLSNLRARQVSPEDFDTFDYVLAMDQHNLYDLNRMVRGDFDGYLGLFLPFAARIENEVVEHEEVPDPYYGGEDGFNQVLDMVEIASQGLLDHICQQQGWAASD